MPIKAILCPHCMQAQEKQINNDYIDHTDKAIGVFKCETANPADDSAPLGCGKDFVIYARAEYHVKAVAVGGA